MVWLHTDVENRFYFSINKLSLPEIFALLYKHFGVTPGRLSVTIISNILYKAKRSIKSER